MLARNALLHTMLVAITLCITSAAQAGVSNAMGFFNYFTNPQNLGSAPVGASVTFNDTLFSSTGPNTLTGLSISGEFSLNTTCVIGNIYNTSQTCALNTNFAPVTPGPHTGVLTVSCTPTPMIGGVTFICDGLPHTFSFLGIGVGAAAAIPALDRWAITLLALVLMGWGTLHLRQRQRRR